MSTHRYHRRDLNADLLRAGLGSAACITPLFLLEPGAIASYVLAVPAAFFILFGLRTWAHGRTRVTLDDSGVVIDGWTASRLSWRDLETLKLSYFSTRRDREAGWMHLTLRGAGTKLSIHSTLEGFEDVCRQALRAAQTHDVELSDATARNFAALGMGSTGELAPPIDTTPAALTGWGNPADWRR
ncbi:MAG: hypothetical protein ACKVJT_01385 [Alphaproteobacteria bacterium]